MDQFGLGFEPDVLANKEETDAWRQTVRDFLRGRGVQC